MQIKNALSEIPHDIDIIVYSPLQRTKESAKIVFGNVYTQWGNIEYQKVSDIITSMFGN